MRNLTSDMQVAVAASEGGDVVYFIRVETSAGFVYLCTAPVGVDWDGHTWQGIGGLLVFDSVAETPDASGQGLELALSGVDQAMIALILENEFRGRDLNLWLAQLEDGAVISDPVDLGTYKQLSDYTINESRGDDSTVTIKTRVQSRLAALTTPQAVRTNTISHNDMLKRAGLPTGDTFFQNAPAIKNRNIAWGPFIIGGPQNWLASIGQRLRGAS